MYLVGHAIVAFLIAFGISKKFKVGEISFALVMLLACLPDIDIVLQSAGVTAHKTYTHSPILSAVIVPSIILTISRWKKLPAGVAAIYSMAYVSHIAIGDIVVGGTNIMYPFGNMMTGSGISYGTLVHQALELLLLAGAAGIIVSKSFRVQSSDDLFRFNGTDKVAYALLIAALAISFAYLLNGIRVLPRLFIETDLELTIFIVLHLSAIALVSFLALTARRHASQQEKLVKSERWFGGREPDKL